MLFKKFEQNGPRPTVSDQSINKSLHRVPVVSGSVTISTTSVVHFAIFDKPVDFRLNKFLAVVLKSSRAKAYINGFITSVEFAKILKIIKTTKTQATTVMLVTIVY